MWPTITVCNLNQVEASFMKDVGAFGDIESTNILINEFIHGRQEDLTADQENIVNEVKEKIGSDWSFSDWSRQKCKNLFISMSFRGRTLTWKDLPQDWEDEMDLGPYLYPTDFGACCFLAPHLNLEATNWNLSYTEMYHELIADSLNGETNGLDLVLDAEQFNYGYYQANAAGFKISLHHHADKPMIQFSSQLINSGTETQINLKPTISYTTEDAIYAFPSEERGCYADGEANLTYLIYEDGYRYEMNNCLIDEGIRDIIWNCRCTPRFWQACSFCDEDYAAFIKYCTGEGLYCANTRMKSIGQGKMSKENDLVMPEALETPDMIGNISKPDPVKCIPACDVQENNNQMSFAPYPQLGNFFYQNIFCDAASHILQVTCQDANRKFFMDKKQPNLCLELNKFEEYFGNTTSCEYWPTNYFENNDAPNENLVTELYQYGRDNLALVHVLVQSPYITKLKRDVSMTFTSYIANTGGLLGLCLGFSLITGFEMIFWCCCCCKEFKKNIAVIRPVRQ